MMRKSIDRGSLILSSYCYTERKKQGPFPYPLLRGRRSKEGRGQKREGPAGGDNWQRWQDLRAAEGGEEEEKDITASCPILLRAFSRAPCRIG
jgi:hypothetical protein